MALPETSETDKRSDPQKGPDKKEKLLTKVIIRRLPPNMDPETFLNQISPVPNYDYFYMVKGDASLGENSFARAYINFTNPLDVYNFKERFDNYVFLDSAGHEYPAVVEFAAFQKIPKRRNKVRVDPKIGTIESDPYYLEFVEMLNKPPEQEEKPEYTYQITEPKNDANESTPLLEYVKNKRVEKMRIREERREERKRKEFEKKKFREDERRKRFEERSPINKGKSAYTKVSPKEKTNENKETEKTKSEENEKAAKVEEKTVEKEEFDSKYDKPTSSNSYYKNRDNRDKNKYEDRKKDVKNKYPPKKDFIEKREYKRRDDYRDRDYRTNKYEDYKKEDPKVYQKKAKKYTEKREERKIEAQKAEQKKLEQQQEGTSKEDITKTIKEEKVSENFSKKEEKLSPKKDQNREFKGGNMEKESKSRDCDSSKQGRIRNKDRPTIAIYRPGMLSKRRQTESDTESKESKKE